MQYDRPIVLSIGGFDPTGGAGVLADVKTVEQNGCLGMAVLTASTIQTEERVLSINWFKADEIIDQIEALISVYSIKVFKIGIVENLNCLHLIVSYLSERLTDVEVIWDPVLRSSSGFSFTNEIDSILLEKILKHITLVTPNALEIISLTGKEDETEASEILSKLTSVLMKGGHRSAQLGEDILLHDGKKWVFPPSIEPFYDKHGTGCILSSAIAAQLACGKSLPEACEIAKNYVTKLSQSNPKKLAYHVA